MCSFKTCTKCEDDFPETNDFFQWDSSVKRFASQCKVCRKKKKKKSDAGRRKKLEKEFGSEYQYRKVNQPGFIEKTKIRHRKKGKIRQETLSNLYVARLIKRNTSLTTQDVMNQPKLINAKRQLIKITRILKNESGR